MTKPEIIQQLHFYHQHFIDKIHDLPADAFLYSRNNKWTAGQQLDHICRSIKPVAMAFGLPAFVLRLLFGKANRPSRIYDALIEKYTMKLAAGGRASGRFIPKEIGFNDRDRLVKRLQFTVSRLENRIGRYSEEELDTYILPHPLLGKLTLREMLYFCIYHVQHHEKLIWEQLSN
jgi:hypothetical protein